MRNYWAYEIKDAQGEYHQHTHYSLRIYKADEVDAEIKKKDDWVIKVQLAAMDLITASLGLQNDNAKLIAEITRLKNGLLTKEK